MAGFDVKTQEEIINDLLLNIVTLIDDIDDVNVGSVLRTLTEALGIELSQLYQELQNIYDGTRIDTATGTDLENLGKLLGIVRKLGTTSQGYVTFKRQTPAPVDFVIPLGTIISTQPNTEEEQLRFIVDSNTTYLSSIIDEEQLFINGIYEYPLDERFIDSVQSLDGTVSAVGFTFTEGVDFEITKDYTGIVIDTSTLTTLDTCDSVFGWTANGGAISPTLDLVSFRQGTASINLGKNSILTDEMYYDKILPSVVNISGKQLVMWIYFHDQGEINKLTYLELSIGSGGSINNSYTLKYESDKLSPGWNKIVTDFTLSTINRQGFPNQNAMNYLRLACKYDNIAGITTLGQMKMDFWFGANVSNYTGDLITFLQSGQLPDNNTTFQVDYKPLSKEVLCKSEDVGEKYNVSTQKIIYKVSFITNIDSVRNYLAQTGGTDTETDDDLRARILAATDLLGKATVTALTQAVLGVEGVTSVSVDDMPLRTSSTEPHEYINFITTPSLALDHEVAQNDINFIVSGTRGAAPYVFVKNTDYFVEDSIIYWINDTLDPDDGTLVYVDYNYRWLGHVDIFVAGTSTPLSTEVSDNIDTAIFETKSAGIDVVWSEPTIVTIPITVNIAVLTGQGFTFAGVQPYVSEAIENFLNMKDTGADVLIAEIIDVVMGVEGMYNTTVTLPAVDVIINVDEVARAGTITVNSL